MHEKEMGGMRKIKLLFGILLLMALPATVQAQFAFTTNIDGTITIVGFTGNDGCPYAAL
jgi:hypothetical protein